MTARDALDGIKAQLAADQSKTVNDAKFGDVLRTGWCTYYFGADSQWHNARTGEVIQDLEALEDERQADDEVSVWLTTPTDVARLIGAVEAVLLLAGKYDHEADRLAAKAERFIPGEVRSRYLGESTDARMRGSLIRNAVENALKEEQ